MRGESILSEPIFSIKKISKRIGDVPIASISGKTIPGSSIVQRSHRVTVRKTREQVKATQIRAECAVKGAIPSIAKDQNRKCATSVTIAKNQGGGRAFELRLGSIDFSWPHDPGERRQYYFYIAAVHNSPRIFMSPRNRVRLIAIWPSKRGRSALCRPSATRKCMPHRTPRRPRTPAQL
jgi:hypothetical protein